MLPRHAIAAGLAFALVLVAAPVAADVVDADVTLRVAPTFSQEATPSTGYVVPSEHVYAAAAEPTLEGALGTDVPRTTSPAVWLRDPAETDAYDDETGVAGCSLTAEDADGNGDVTADEVLDQAAADGCITGWDYHTTFGDPMMSMVDGLWKSNLTATGYPVGWWQIQKNLHVAHAGVASLTVDDGDSLGFVFMRHG